MNQERIFKVLLGPHITEKTAMAGETVVKWCLRLLSMRLSLK